MLGNWDPLIPYGVPGFEAGKGTGELVCEAPVIPLELLRGGNDDPLLLYILLFL